MKLLVAALPGQWRVESRRALGKHWRRPNELDFRLIEKGDDSAYPKILAELWAQKQDFAVVEPDIVIRADVAEEILHCDCQYGCFPYAWTTDVGAALGCTWFRSSFLEKYPNAMREVMAKNITWRQLDVVLMRHILARKYKEQPHIHLPPVVHLNEAKQLLSEASPEPLMYVPEW